MLKRKTLYRSISFFGYALIFVAFLLATSFVFQNKKKSLLNEVNGRLVASENFFSVFSTYEDLGSLRRQMQFLNTPEIGWFEVLSVNEVLLFKSPARITATLQHHERVLSLNGKPELIVRFALSDGAVFFQVLEESLPFIFLIFIVLLSGQIVIFISRRRRECDQNKIMSLLASSTSILDLKHSDEFADQIESIYLRNVFLRFVDFSVKMATLNEDLTKRKSAEVMVNLAKQVSHDLRSPLSAIQAILPQLASLPENQRVILRASLNRMSDIANTLLQKGKEQTQADKAGGVVTGVAPELSVELLPSLVDSIVSEKRIQFRDKIGIEIEGSFVDSYGAFAAINTTELQRLISNSVNNSVESFPDCRGKIIVAVEKMKDFSVLSISDNGKGIPPHILKRLGEVGVTHGKEGTQSGSGLGVYHAKKTIESFGGKFEIQTEEGVGTRIAMTLPAATPTPKWFLEKLTLEVNSIVVSLDDDSSIHSVYSNRFDSLNISASGIKHIKFTSGLEFRDWVKINDGNSKSIYLCDYELFDQTVTGLDLIEQLQICDRAILVTSRFEEAAIRGRCEKLGIRLIPKTMASLVPLEVELPRERYDVCLLDDDNLVAMSWRMVSETRNKTFIYFSNPNDFFLKAPTLDFGIPIYVDSNLGNGVKGEEISKKIHEMGFREIYLCTGYQASDFPEMLWIKGIVSKDAPWV